MSDLWNNGEATDEDEDGVEEVEGGPAPKRHRPNPAAPPATATATATASTTSTAAAPDSRPMAPAINHACISIANLFGANMPVEYHQYIGHVSKFYGKLNVYSTRHRSYFRGKNVLAINAGSGKIHGNLRGRLPRGCVRIIVIRDEEWHKQTDEQKSFCLNEVEAVITVDPIITNRADTDHRRFMAMVFGWMYEAKAILLMDDNVKFSDPEDACIQFVNAIDEGYEVVSMPQEGSRVFSRDQKAAMIDTPMNVLTAIIPADRRHSNRKRRQGCIFLQPVKDVQMAWKCFGFSYLNNLDFEQIFWAFPIGIEPWQDMFAAAVMAKRKSAVMLMLPHMETRADTTITADYGFRKAPADFLLIERDQGDLRVSSYGVPGEDYLPDLCICNPAHVKKMNVSQLEDFVDGAKKRASSRYTLTSEADGPKRNIY